ncbi:MAG: succinate dehydrogenase cytochrome b subunit [Flavobacteriales bacterium]|nr:succinate dehydrogenase cytochrome b subunit [Flavobacteriales bacterium]
MSNHGITKSSVGRKVLMALSGFFLLIFLLQHFCINFLSVISPGTFNSVSDFMGYNPLVQFALQPLLIFGVIFHLAMGIYLDGKNRKARPVKYGSYNGAANATWMSRNMIISGLMILAFLGLHFYDFWIHEINEKYVEGGNEAFGSALRDPNRYYQELQEKFVDIWRVIIYVGSFVLLSLHLLHGFQSAFQSVGFRHTKYTPVIKKLGTIYAIIIPLGFIFIALFHHIKMH